MDISAADVPARQVATDPLIGQVLAGRYHVTGWIARGGMATVYTGRDLKLSRDVAIKIMRPDVARQEGFAARFLGEAKAAAAVAHPNVVTVYDQGSSGEHVFLIMEYVPGRTLRDLLSERGRLGPRQALSLMQHVLSALAAAHQAGLVHRDVKPENVLLAEDGRVKVADFGLARSETADRQTSTGLIVGTAAYLAPEQVLSRPVDARCDVYAAGIVLFELLTGVQPHRGDSPLAVAYKHVNETVPFPSTLLPGLPPQLDTLVAVATAHAPERRPADAAHYLTMLAEVGRGLPAGIDQALAGVALVEPPPGSRPAPLQGPAPVQSPVPHQIPARFQSPAPQQSPGPQQGSGPQQSPALHQSPAPHQTLVDNNTTQMGPLQNGTSILPTGLLSHAGRQPEESSVINRVMAAVTGRVVLICVGVTAVAVLAWAIWFQTSGQYRTVPGVVGLPVNVARAQLESQGFRVVQGTGRNNDQIAKNAVVATKPAAGERIGQGGLITIFPSLGRSAIKMPYLKGASQAEAQSRLRGLGITYTTATEQSKDQPPGQVNRTDPAAGQPVVPGTDTVTIYVSTGVAIPGVVGQTQEAAAKALQDAGFQVSITQQQPAPGQQPDIVLSQNPAAGTAGTPGQTITLVATMKAPAPPSPAPPNGPPGNQAAVPNVVGMKFNEAAAALQAAGFGVNAGDHHDNGQQVSGQNPPGGTQAQPGSTVTIW